MFAELRRAAGLSSRPADDVLRGLGLPAEALDRPVSTFSRGMAQRVALARAVAGDPELLLLDEPFTALDARGRAQLAGALLAERDRGAAILLSSHDQGTLLRVCDRLVLLEAGAIVREVERGATTRPASPPAQARSSAPSALTITPPPEPRRKAAGPASARFRRAPTLCYTWRRCVCSARACSSSAASCGRSCATSSWS
ncbi:ATP-binding cassette domain-containing protein [Nannocystis pusilla]|uniref:ATP-binding cassette domain-containing protein n=1 Tax=Nannocystis pusilla TaxID=889268 RepID=UPI003B7FB4F4